jgi:amino acid adenylation domain-containing protein
MLTVFKALLHRYTGQDDLVVGSAVANRNRPETERLVGMLVNNVALRVNASGDPTFRQLLSRVKEVALDAYANQDAPFERVVEELHLDRDLSRNPLFQVSFSFHDSPMPTLTLSDLSVSVLEGLSNGSAKFDLNVVAIPRFEQSVGRGELPPSEGVLLLFEYCTDLFESDTIEWLARRYLRMIAEAVSDPDRRISAVPMLEESERRQLLSDTRTDHVVAASTVPAMLDTQAEETSQRVAVVSKAGSTGYRELHARAHGLARLLIGRGARAERAVVLALPRTECLVVAVLAVLKAGSAVLLVDPDHPMGRMRGLLDDAAPSLLLTTREVADRSPAGEQVPQVLLDDAGFLDELSRHPADAVSDEDRPEPLMGEHAAFVGCAPGPDGRLNGVVLNHHNLVNTLTAMRHETGVGPHDVMCAATTLPLDNATLALLLALSVGARLVLAGPDTADGHRLSELLTDEQATLVQATPENWRALIAAGLRFDGLTVVSSGEVPPTELTEELVVRGARVWSWHGAPEATVVSLARVVSGTDPAAHASSLGQPVINTRAYVVDSRGNLTPTGIPGELYVGGAGVGRGYLGHAALTADRFVPDPFSGRPGARLFRTGDRVRRTRDGALEYLGRVDRQVRIHGCRFDPAEIEAASTRHPDVREAVVVASGDTGGTRLTAYLRPAPSGVDLDDLRTAVSDVLPGYLVPAEFVEVSEWPLTPDGQTDRARLSRLGASRPRPASFVAPRTSTEAQLATVWVELLGVDRVSADDNFFKLGGHSLLAMMAVSRAQEMFGVNIEVASIFDRPTLEGFSRVIDDAAQLEHIPTRSPDRSEHTIADLLAEVEQRSGPASLDSAGDSA